MATNASTRPANWIKFDNFIITVIGAYVPITDNERDNEYYIGISLNTEGSHDLPLYIEEYREKEGIEEFVHQALQEIAEMVPHFNHPEVIKSRFVNNSYPRIEELYRYVEKAVKVFDREPAEEEPFFVLNVNYHLYENCTWYRTAEDRNAAAEEAGFEVKSASKEKTTLTYSTTDASYTYDKGFHGARNRRW